MSRVLVTGASGFVAADLVPRLLQHGHEVTVASRRVIPEFAVLPLRRCHGLDLEALEHRLALTAADAPSRALSGEALSDEGEACWREALSGVDVVVHLAARVHVMGDTESDPLVANRRYNRDATANLARLAYSAGVKRFIFVSSIKVNGEQTCPGQPFTHASTPAPEDPYGVSKWEAEQALHEIARKTGLEVVIIRPALVYGVGAKGNLALLLRVLSGGWPLPLGAVRNQRSLLARSNLCDFLVRCVSHPNAVGECFLLADCSYSTPLLLRHLAIAGEWPVRLLPIPVSCLKLMASLLGRRAWIKRLCDSLELDCSRTFERLNWQPAVAPEQELAAMVRASKD